MYAYRLHLSDFKFIAVLEHFNFPGMVFNASNCNFHRYKYKHSHAAYSAGVDETYYGRVSYLQRVMSLFRYRTPIDVRIHWFIDKPLRSMRCVYIHTINIIPGSDTNIMSVRP